MNPNEVEVNIVDDYGGTTGRVYSSSTFKSTLKKGISFGTCLAMVISYVAWKSIPWAIFHGLLGWIYVIYYALIY